MTIGMNGKEGQSRKMGVRNLDVNSNVKTPWQRAVLVAIFSGCLGFGLLFVFSTVSWWLYPYPESASQDEIILIWASHCFFEKVFGLGVLAICAIVAASPFRSTQWIGLGTSIGSGFIYQAITIIVYVTRFGLVAYLETHRFFSTIGATIAISGLFGLIVTRGLYRRDQHQNRTRR